MNAEKKKIIIPLLLILTLGALSDFITSEKMISG